MKTILMIISIVFMFAGMITFLTAESAIHEILAVLAIGFGVVYIGLGGIIAAIEDASKK